LIGAGNWTVKKRFFFSVQTASETYRIRQLQAEITTSAVITTFVVVGIVGSKDLDGGIEVSMGKTKVVVTRPQKSIDENSACRR
jgi:hypothetical protein